MASENIINLTNDEFQNVVNSDGVVLVDFWASWCGPCKALAPIIDEVSNDYANQNVKVCKVNVDEEQKLTSKFKIMTIPTVMIFKGGEVVDQSIGLRTKGEIEDMIKGHL